MKRNEIDKSVVIPVTSIRQGMRVDLESCPYLKNEPSAYYEWAVVRYALRESVNCFAIRYDGIDIVGYDPSITLAIRNGCYECCGCREWVSYKDNLLLDGTNLEHARENELCKDCQQLDDVSHDIANKFNGIVNKVGKVTITINNSDWLVTINPEKNNKK